MTHVSLPQPQSTIADDIASLARKMLQVDQARQNAQALVGQLEESNAGLRRELEAMKRTATAIADERSSLATELFQVQRQLEETQALLATRDELLHEVLSLSDLDILSVGFLSRVRSVLLTKEATE